MNTRAQTNKHQQKTEETRRRLLKAARRIFARDGFEAAKIEDIAREAGHTRGAFYANFQSKEELFFALVQQESVVKVARLHRILECCPKAEDRLKVLREYYVRRTADRQWVMLMLEFKLYAVRHGHLRARFARALRRIRSSVQVNDLQSLLPASVQVSPDSNEVRRTALESALNGLVLEHAYDPKRISEKQVASILRRVFDLLIQH